MSEGPRRRRDPLVAHDASPHPVSRLIGHAPVALLVEDDEEMREMLVLSLSLERWTVIEAASGEEAIEAWHRASPDVVLLDQQLAGMTGLECAAQLRAMSSDTRIILFSAVLQPAVLKEARRLRVLPLEKADRRRLFDLLGVLAMQVRQMPTRVG